MDISMQERRERIIDLMDSELAMLPEDNQIYENYRSRNVLNYLQSIRTIDQIIKEEEGWRK